MSQKLEQEVKFHIPDLPGLQEKLEGLGAELEQPRTYERNLRFDNSGGDLSAMYQVLRLRHDTRSRLTYKGSSDLNREVNARQELEVEVSDFETAQEILEALGYEVVVIYEKHRSAYMLGNVEVSLDEMPFGTFIEIEGPDTDSVRDAAEKLGVAWEERIVLGYMTMFQILKERLVLEFRDLTFGNFEGIQISLADLDFSGGY